MSWCYDVSLWNHQESLKADLQLQNFLKLLFLSRAGLQSWGLRLRRWSRCMLKCDCVWVLHRKHLVFVFAWMGERGTLYKVLWVFKQSRKVRCKKQNFQGSVLLFECLSVFTVSRETAVLQCVNAACTLTLLPTADVVLKWFVLAPLYPLTVLVVLFRCEGKIISLRCRHQQTQLFARFSLLVKENVQAEHIH